MAGSNNIGNDRSAALRLKFRSLICKLSEKKSPSIVMGILPRLGAGKYWTTQAREINRWLQIKCVERGILFIDLFDKFYNSRFLYKYDGIHLNENGKTYICEVFNEILNEHSIFKPFLA